MRMGPVLGSCCDDDVEAGVDSVSEQDGEDAGES